MLTARQADLLRFIERRLAETGGVAPSYNEMAMALGLKSRAGICRLLEELEQRGFVRRLGRLPRSIEVLRTIASVRPSNVIEANFGQRPAAVEPVCAVVATESHANGVELAVHGEWVWVLWPGQSVPMTVRASHITSRRTAPDCPGAA